MMDKKDSEKLGLPELNDDDRIDKDWEYISSKAMKNKLGRGKSEVDQVHPFISKCIKCIIKKFAKTTIINPVQYGP